MPFLGGGVTKLEAFQWCFVTKLYPLKPSLFYGKYKLIFHFWYYFSSFMHISVKHNAFWSNMDRCTVHVYIKNYQRPFKILSKKNLHKNVRLWLYVTQKYIPIAICCLNFNIWLAKACFWKNFFLNIQIFCYLSYKCHCSHPRDPCEVSLALYGLLDFYKHINNDDINFLCWTLSL